MPNLYKLKTVCAAILERPVADFTTSDAVDLFLLAADNARRSAETQHNFEFCRITGKLSVDGVNGGKFTDITDVVGAATGGLRELTAVKSSTISGSQADVGFSRPEVAQESDRDVMLVQTQYDYNERYRPDWGSYRTARLIERGGGLYIYPPSLNLTTPLSLIVEGYGWLPDYTALGAIGTAPQDYFVSKGFAYMQWAIVCELNYIWQKFVPRQEGNLTAPEKNRDMELQRLITDDSYSIDANSAYDRA